MDLKSDIPIEPKHTYFQYAHLTREDLKEVSKIVCDARDQLIDKIPKNKDYKWELFDEENGIRDKTRESFDFREFNAGMRKLLEAKDCFVRAFI